jgi:3-hydroxy-9,10-secoandrosta-1,3,5(10)-triene-9,17-dione monooxygenase reductase component
MNDPVAESPDPRRFRSVMGSFPTGVAVVTALRPDGAPVGLTANSLTSVSLDPLLVLVCIDHGSASHDAIVDSGAFAVNLLNESGRGLSDLFARGEREDRFVDVEWHAGLTGSPVLEDALGWIDCRVHQTHVAGDHTIVVGRVVACDHTDQDPLVYHRGAYGRLARP